MPDGTTSDISFYKNGFKVKSISCVSGDKENENLKQFENY